MSRATRSVGPSMKHAEVFERMCDGSCRGERLFEWGNVLRGDFMNGPAEGFVVVEMKMEPYKTRRMTSQAR